MPGWPREHHHARTARGPGRVVVSHDFPSENERAHAVGVIADGGEIGRGSRVPGDRWRSLVRMDRTMAIHNRFDGDIWSGLPRSTRPSAARSRDAGRPDFPAHLGPQATDRRCREGCTTVKVASRAPDSTLSAGRPPARTSSVLSVRQLRETLESPACNDARGRSTTARSRTRHQTRAGVRSCTM